MTSELVCAASPGPAGFWLTFDLSDRLRSANQVCDGVSLKVEKPQDMITGNPAVIKLLVNFYRHAGGQSALRDSLGPALQELLLDPGLSIRTDPLEVYKAWINLSETQSGCRRCGGFLGRT